MAYSAPTLGVVTPTNAATDLQSLQVGSPFKITVRACPRPSALVMLRRFYLLTRHVYHGNSFQEISPSTSNSHQKKALMICSGSVLQEM